MLLAMYWWRAQGASILWPEVYAVGAAVCIGLPPVLVARAIYRAWYITLAAAAAAGFIVLSQVCELLSVVALPGWLQGFPLVDQQFALRPILLNTSLHVGMALLAFTFYLCLLEGDRYRRSLAAQTAALRDAVAEQTRSRHALREERDRVQQYLDAVGEVIGCIDLEGRFTLLNKSGYDLLGHPYGSMEGSAFCMIAPKGDQHALRERFSDVVAGRRQPSGRFEQAVVTASGEERLVLWHNRLLHDSAGAMSGMILSGVDITDHRREEEERRALERRAQQAQRMESLGVLAGGIAHEFNNLLMSLLGNTELALLDVPADSPAAERLAAVETAAQRAARLTREMLDYSGRGPLVVEPVELSALTRDMGQLIKAAVGDRIKVCLEMAEGLPVVEGDSGQLKQVILNLVTNAGEAMAKQGGTLTIRTAAVDMTAKYLATVAPQDALPAGRYVSLEVHDEGVGMDAETRRRAFDPFFTTQFPGRGLGLAAVLGTIRSHRGAIELESTPGEGTSVRVLLPALLSEAAVAKQDGRPAPAWLEKRAVLLVDDDRAVLEVGREYLEILGIAVFTAASGEEALEVLARSLDHVGCVILDHQMPGLESTETRERIEALRPGLPVLLSSGYSHDDLASRMDFTGFAGFLQKPYRSGELAAALREFLEPTGAKAEPIPPVMREA